MVMIWYRPTSLMRVMMIGVIRRLANIEISIVAAARAPNWATTVKLENTRMPNPSARASGYWLMPGSSVIEPV